MIQLDIERDCKPARHIELRRALVSILSPNGLCAKCREYVGIGKLEIDHVKGRTNWQPRELSKLQRIKRYWTEYLADVSLRALCRSCNGGHLNNSWRSRDERKSA